MEIVGNKIALAPRVLKCRESFKLNFTIFYDSILDSRPKVAVIGAGISGLAAAASLEEKGFHVYLLEASDYIGMTIKPSIIIFIVGVSACS